MPDDNLAPPSPDELQPDVPAEQDALHQQLVEAVHHLVRCGWGYPEIGRAMGYKEGSARQPVSRIVNEGWTPPAARAKLLSRAASRRGFDGVAEDFSAASKRAVRLARPESYETDACIAEELRKAQEGLGLASSVVRAGEALREARRHALRVVAGGSELVYEIEDMMRDAGQPVPQAAPSGFTGGDGLPADATVSL